MAAPIFDRAVGPGTHCRNCRHHGLRLAISGGPVLKQRIVVTLPTTPGIVVEACLVCDQNPADGPPTSRSSR